MSEMILSARVAPMDVSRAARSAGFSGTDSRASVVRYAIMRLAGLSPLEAMQLCKPEPRGGLEVTGGNITVPIERRFFDDASRVLPPGTPRGVVIRYALFRADGYSHDEALDEATRKVGRPRKGGQP